MEQVGLYIVFGENNRRDEIMKVRIITEREFPFEDLSRWIRHCISIGIPLDEDKLRKDGFCEFDCDNGYTKAHSRYELIKDTVKPV